MLKFLFALLYFLVWYRTAELKVIYDDKMYFRLFWQVNSFVYTNILEFCPSMLDILYDYLPLEILTCLS